MNDEERDELLIRVDERVCMIIKQLMPALSKRVSNHIRYHWAVSIPVIMLILGLVIALLTK